MRVPVELAAVGVTVGEVWRETDDSQRFLHTPGDPGVAGVAERQGGAISIAQLRDVGLGEGAIRHRVVRGRLHRIHHGVYAVGHPCLTPRGHMWAAVLACGGPDVAVLSYGTAGAVWDLLPSPAKFDVTTLRAGHSTPKIRVHRSQTLRPADITHDDGLPAAARRPYARRWRPSPPTTRTSPGRGSRSGSSPCSSMRGYRGRRSTPPSAPTKSTSCGARAASSSRPTALPRT